MEVEEYLKKKDNLQVLIDPSCLFNCDETTFFLNPKGTKVLVGKEYHNIVYQQVNSDDKECLTVLITVII